MWGSVWAYGFRFWYLGGDGKVKEEGQYGIEEGI
jgi:hypothetical protein